MKRFKILNFIKSPLLKYTKIICEEQVMGISNQHTFTFWSVIILSTNINELLESPAVWHLWYHLKQYNQKMKFRVKSNKQHKYTDMCQFIFLTLQYTIDSLLIINHRRLKIPFLNMLFYQSYKVGDVIEFLKGYKKNRFNDF